jgi:hypothetical protein
MTQLVWKDEVGAIHICEDASGSARQRTLCRLSVPPNGASRPGRRLVANCPECLVAVQKAERISKVV